MTTELIRGFTIGMGLIVAIGAQNAFLLGRAVRGERALLVAAICALCDASLITLAVTGVGGSLARYPIISLVATVGGIVFLIGFGARAFRSARVSRGLPADTAPRTVTLRGTVLATLMVSLLNPHALLDTFVVIGGLTAPLEESARHAFGLGAVLASVTWFALLATAGKRLAPRFRKPSTWRALDLFVGASMWLIAALLTIDLVRG